MVDKNLKNQFAVYDSDTPVAFKQGRGHQIRYGLIDPEQGYNNANIEEKKLT